LASAGTAVTVVAALAYFLTRPLPPPRALRYIQITNDAQGKVWYPWFSGLATDGSRVYFMEGTSLVQVSVGGGETVRIPPSLRDPYTALFDISPDRTELLVGSPGIEEAPLWILPVPGRTPRRIGDVMAHDGTWFPDGRRLLYANSHYLYSVRRDGAESRPFLDVAGTVWWPRWSGDGSRLRFTVYDPSSNSNSLWEASADGRNVHPWLPGWNKPSEECCGNWTPDGKYFVFQSTRDGRTDIWARREEGWFLRNANPEPVRLTAGPIETSLPVPSPDGKRLYVVGVQRHGELVRYDPRSQQFLPYLSGISAEHLDFSRDGQWVTYVAYPEATLWRSKVDGTERFQLTSSPLQASEPVWSPDGRWIAFMGTEPRKPWKLYLVSADGGVPQRLMPGERMEANPGWSPDGTRLVFGRIPWLEGGTAGVATIQVLDLKTKRVSTLPGSEGLMSPRWSSDGRYIAAMTYGFNWIQVLFDFTTQKWAELTKVAGVYNRWSRDGKYVYFHGALEGGAIFRVRVSDRRLERVVTLGDMRRAHGVFGDWNGLAPDDSVLITRDVGIQEIYALDVEWP
jgi:Tol biopolymer transport system component